MIQVERAAIDANRLAIQTKLSMDVNNREGGSAQRSTRSPRFVERLASIGEDSAPMAGAVTRNLASLAPTGEALAPVRKPIALNREPIDLNRRAIALNRDPIVHDHGHDGANPGID